MIPDDRREEILRILQEKRYMTVQELAKMLYVSEPTVRRDLVDLEREGSIKRARGGASYLGTDPVQWPFSFRHKSHTKEKQYIADLAASFIEAGDYIYLDGSSTCYCLAQEIGNPGELRVLTNGIPTLTALSEQKNVIANCLCGTYDQRRSNIYGYDACEFISHQYADSCFISCYGFTLDQGPMDYAVEDAAIKKSFIRYSKKTILLIDHSKIGKTSRHQICAVRDLFAVVTDQPLPSEYEKALTEQGIEIVY